MPHLWMSTFRTQISSSRAPPGGKLGKVTSLSLANLKIQIRSLRQNLKCGGRKERTGREKVKRKKYFNLYYGCRRQIPYWVHQLGMHVTLWALRIKAWDL